MSAFRFRCVAFDETSQWAALPPECYRAFGIYVFKEGEATYCASIQPSSWCQFIGNAFSGLPPEHPYMEAHWDVGSDMYAPLIDTEKQAAQVSTAFEFDAHSDAEAWCAAVEYFCANQPRIACLQTN